MPQCPPTPAPAGHISRHLQMLGLQNGILFCLSHCLSSRLRLCEEDAFHQGLFLQFPVQLGAVIPSVQRARRLISAPLPITRAAHKSWLTPLSRTAEVPPQRRSHSEWLSMFASLLQPFASVANSIVRRALDTSCAKFSGELAGL